MWQPINTAPADGTPLLGYQADGQIEVMWFSGVDGQWVYGDFYGFETTHWMELPEAPK